ncbi:hypothetical protein [[Mycoplasma] mobile]|uniref:hypothetical protein n=1 Tax=[Mycoplasma] mobile TaxID=2118 RepID=UPI00059C8426|nr:hypothetical protein [[Mycoplasma] mobile]
MLEIWEIYEKFCEVKKMNFYFKSDILNFSNKSNLLQIKKDNILHLLGLDHIKKIYNETNNKLLDNNAILKLIKKKQITNSWIEKLSWNNRSPEIKKKAKYILNKIEFWNFFILDLEFNLSKNPNFEFHKNDFLKDNKINYYFKFTKNTEKYFFVLGCVGILRNEYSYNLFIPVTVQKKSKRDYLIEKKIRSF